MIRIRLSAGRLVKFCIIRAEILEEIQLNSPISPKRLTLEDLYSNKCRVGRASGEPHHVGQGWWGSPKARPTLRLHLRPDLANA